MVALNPDYAPSKTLERSKNRVGDFFSEGADCVGLNRPASRMGTREKVGYGYETASGRPIWTSADPAGFPDGPNRHFYAPVPTMGLDPMGLAVFLTSHSVSFGSSGGSSGAPTGGSGFQHASIFGQPDNPSAVSNMPNSNVNGPNPNGYTSAASGTYTTSAGPVNDNLVADFNRGTDVMLADQTNHGEILPPPGMTDAEFNEAIIQATENYIQNTGTNPLDYNFAAGNFGGGYNSNSFIGSVLRHLGAQLPAGFDPSMFPGWSVDLPPGEL